MSRHLETGRQGEQTAAEYLTQQGYQLVEKNYRAGRAEIDLIVRKEQLLVFVEVKTRRNVRYGLPEAAVTSGKSALVTRAAEQYIFDHNWPHEIRFDIVSVMLTPQGWEIEHLEDAFGYS